jgi:signal transduction histidine kinase/ActR/RegA family two-component response regulator
LPSRRRHRLPRASAILARRDEGAGKYQELCAKYRELVRKYEANTTRTSSVMVLAIAAMRAGATALAAIRDGRCVVRNERWVRLAEDDGGTWRLSGAGVGGDGGERQRASLEALALARARALVRTAQPTWAGRYERADGGTVVELRLERTNIASPPLVLALATDVTERVRADREVARMKDVLEAQERLRAVGELASGIAHDLNNTLHALRLRLSRLAGCVAGCPEHVEDLKVVERIASDAGARVRRLQDLAHRREDVPNEVVELEHVIEGAVEVSQPDVSDPARRVTIDVDLPDLPRVVGNASELGHVFVNLFLNARDAMSGGGRVFVRGGTTPDGDVEVSVTDEGPGIPPENLERIFEPFFTTKGRRGTGLGLSMAAGVLRRMGGDIRAEAGPDGGATFALRFRPAPDGERKVARSRRVLVDASPRRVLVVDDDPDNLDAMQLVLAERGHHVEVTSSGLDAVARVEAGERYDAVLCDLGLGDASGWDVSARIGAIAPGTRILLVTGWAEEIAPDDPRRRHVACVLSKPLGIDDLREILRDPSPRRGEAPARSERPPEDGAGGRRGPAVPS